MITTSNVSHKIKYLNRINCHFTTAIIHENDQSIQPAVHQLAIASVQINFTASNITQTIACSISFLHRAIHEPVFDPLSKDSNMRKFAHSWSSHDGARDWPGKRFCAHFLYNMILYLLTSLFIGMTFSAGKFSSGRQRKPARWPAIKLVSFIALCYID